MTYKGQGQRAFHYNFQRVRNFGILFLATRFYGTRHKERVQGMTPLDQGNRRFRYNSFKLKSSRLQPDPSGQFDM